MKFIIFVDDTNIVCTGSDSVQLSKIINSELDKLNIWFATNKLSLNVSKTNLCCLAIAKKKNIEISIKNAKINLVYTTKFLGVLIDNKLNWKDHIDLIKTKLSKNIGFMYKAKYLLNRTSSMILYMTVVPSICNLLL